MHNPLAFGASPRDNGQVVLSGNALTLEKQLDHRFLQWAQSFGAKDYRFPSCIPAAALARIDYFQSFPHLATFPCCVARDVNSLRNFSHRNTGAEKSVELDDMAPLNDVLTPAACYHVYVEIEGQSFDGPKYFTTRATCFRAEDRYEPLQRQWSFDMREIVCVGTAGEVQRFLAAATKIIDEWVHSLPLSLTWKTATDPFFEPRKSAKYLFQSVEPVKHELVFDDRLAIASTNFHRNHFGDAFDISRQGESAYSGCVAFGLERWVSACLASGISHVA